MASLTGTQTPHAQSRLLYPDEGGCRALDACYTNRSLLQCPSMRQGGKLLRPDEPLVRISRQPAVVLRATLKCGIIAWTSRLASGVVHWTLVARIGGSYGSPLGG